MVDKNIKLEVNNCLYDATFRILDESYTMYVVEPDNITINGWTFEKCVLYQHKEISSEISFYVKYKDGEKYDFEIRKLGDNMCFTDEDDVKEAYKFALNSISSMSSIMDIIEANLSNDTYFVKLRNLALIKQWRDKYWEK